jgi:Tol biopolymer transport system component
MAPLPFDGATRLLSYNDTETSMTFTDTRARAVRCIASHPRRTLIAIAAGTLMLAGCGSSDNDNGNNGSGSQPPQVNQLNTLKGATKDVTVEMHEGTNMAAAPSPDGTRIAFTAQGALWVMPIAGGTATRITGWEVEPTAPVWSPDGKTIAFQNYAPEGNYHIWTIAPDGSGQAELTTGPNDDREPAWLPDGSGLVFSSDRSNDGQYKIWSVTLSSKALTQLTKGAGAESNPIVSLDGRQLVYVDNGNVVTTTLGSTAAPTVVAPGAAPAFPLTGSGVVYQTPTRALVLGGKEVTTNEDLFPFPVRYLPDGRFMYTADGKIRIRDAAGANPKDVPFSASITVRRPNITTGKDRRLSNLGPRQVMGISAPAISPDGASIAFVALNDVWVMKIGQDPVRLTNDTDRDGSPQWTPDGTAVYFSSEKNNAGQLAIDQVNVTTKVRTRLAAIEGKSMVTPKMSPTGDRIAYSTLSGQLEVWTISSKSAQVIVPSISTQVSTPSWTPDGTKVMVVDNERINNRFREGYNKLRVIDVASKTATFYPVAAAPRQISERDEGAAVLSPDGSKVAFIMDSVLHVMPVGANGAPSGPAVAITTEVADLPTWAGDSQTILYKSANRLRTVQASGGGARDIAINLQYTQAVPAGTTLVRAGALWDGISPTLQRNVDILITGNRITSVKASQAGAEAGATRFVDASALTVMPGLWDPHVHPLTLYQGGQFGQIAALMLSYGLTSTQSVAGPLHQSIEMREALEAGNLIGPRLFVSPPLWEGNRLFYNFARTLRTPEIADMEIAKARVMDADFLKSYVRAPIPIMTRIAQAGLDIGIPTGTHMLSPGTAAGLGGTTHLSATQRMGYGWSKSVGGITYQDAADMHAKADFHLIDTLFSALALSSQDPTILSSNRFVLVPPNFVAGLRTAPAPDAATLQGIQRDAEQEAKVYRAGGLVANGTDSPLVVPGIALHLNLRAAGQVLGNHQALQTVTINAAKMAFVDKDLGTVEAGKLADLVAVRGDPIADLKAAANTEYVIKNGNVYTQAQILAPFTTPVALAARKRAIVAYERLCKAEPHSCEAAGMHAD